MAGLTWLLFDLVLGCLLVYRFADLAVLRPRWAAWMLTVGAGAVIGMGVTSCLFFILPRLSLWLRLLLLAAAAYECRRWRKPKTEAPAERPFPYTSLVWVAFALSLIAVTYGMSTAWDANPQGNWDAWAIWNLRAKFLAAGGSMASRAWSPLLNFTHSEYPLLLSGFVASCWSDAGAISDLVPIATSYVFFVALLCLVTGGIAALRGTTLGLLAGLALLGVPAILTEVPAQYADVPLACYMAGAVLLVLLDRPVAAGVLAGFAAWTKDEGLLFLVILLGAMAVTRRSKVMRFCYGAAPAAALVLAFKLVIARGTHSLIGGSQTGLAQKLRDVTRYQMVAAAMAKELFTWHVGWYHPILPVLVLGFALRFDRGRWKDSVFCLGIGGLLVIGYFAVYLVTPNDLTWQLQSSLTRLFVQVTPILLTAIFLALRVPESALPAEPQKKDARARRKGKK